MTFLEIIKEKFSKGYYGDLLFPIVIIFAMLFMVFSPIFNTDHCDVYCEQKKKLDLQKNELDIKERQIRLENIRNK